MINNTISYSRKGTPVPCKQFLPDILAQVQAWCHKGKAVLCCMDVDVLRLVDCEWTKVIWLIYDYCQDLGKCQCGLPWSIIVWLCHQDHAQHVPKCEVLLLSQHAEHFAQHIWYWLDGSNPQVNPSRIISFSHRHVIPLYQVHSVGTNICYLWSMDARHLSFHGGQVETWYTAYIQPLSTPCTRD